MNSFPDKMIAHVDMDAFFAAIEEARDPSRRGRPVVVGSDPVGGRGRGVVSTCNYKARTFGIHSAMPISESWRRCPDAVYVRPDMPLYSRISKKIFKTFYDFSPVVEPLSIDEAFIDLKGLGRLYGTPYEMATRLKKRIFDETSLTASVGIAAVKSVAKIASDYQKPDGLTIVAAGTEKDFVASMDIKKLWGIGNVLEKKLLRENFRTVSDLRKRSRADWYKLYGKTGEHIYHMAHCLDDREVTDCRDHPFLPKSVSREVTFKSDSADIDFMKYTLTAVLDDVTKTLRIKELTAATVYIKIRLSNFKTLTRQSSLGAHTCDYYMIRDGALALFSKIYKTLASGQTVRLIGAGVSGIMKKNESVSADTSRQLFLTTSADEASGFQGADLTRKRFSIDTLMDDFQKRYGSAALQRASVGHRSIIKKRDDQ